MKLDAKGAKYARFALRGCLTRLALYFERHRTYSGEEVQAILLSAMRSIDVAEEQLSIDIVEGASALLLKEG